MQHSQYKAVPLRATVRPRLAGEDEGDYAGQLAADVAHDLVGHALRA